MKLSSLFLLLGFCFVELITGLDYWNENDYYYIKTGEAAMSNPLLVNLTLIQSDAAKGAVCLVGTLPGYHLDRGFGSGANSWLVNLDVVDVAFAEDQHQITLLISLLLNKDSSIKNVSLHKSLRYKCASLIPINYIQWLVEAFGDLVENCPHLEFCLQWCQELYKAHRQFIHQNSQSLLPALKSLQKSIAKMHRDLSNICSSNEYMLKYLCSTRATI